MAHDILIVDDDPDSREILNLVMQTLEIPLREARNGREALNMLRMDPPMLVILDLTMPDVDGEGVLAQMRVTPSLVTVPVLVFTARELVPGLVAQLGLPPECIQRKGSQSMTHLRDVVIRLLGDTVGLAQ